MYYIEYSEDSQSTGSKFIWNCKEINQDNPSTIEWLNNIQALQIIDKIKAIHMPHKKILEGIFNKYNKVVIKIADTTEDLQKEWQIYERLSQDNIYGIVRYFCYFQCADNIQKYIKNQPHLCEGIGNTLQILVMEYINGKSFKNFDWSSVSIDVFHSCFKQTLLTALDAYIKCKFVHGDFHLDNVLIQKTTRKSLTYLNGTIPLVGYQIKLMDFELSKINATPLYFFKNIKEFVKKSLLLIDFYKIDMIEKMNKLLLYWIENNESNVEKILELLPLIDAIKPSGFRGGSYAYSNKKRRIHFQKKPLNI